MKLVLIHQSFVDHNHPGGTRHVEMARYLVRQGHDITVVAGNLNYLTGKRFVDSSDWVVRQTFDGVAVLRTYVYPSLHQSFAWRVFAYLSFMFTSIYAGLRAGKIDLVMGTSPPIFQLFSAWVVSVIRWRPLIVEIRDLWPEFAIDMGILQNRFLIGLARLWESFIYSRATHLVVNSPAYRDYLINKGVSVRKITVVPNGVDATMFTPDSDGASVRHHFGLADAFVVVYAGAMGVANDIVTIINAAELLKDNRDVRFLLVGDGKERPRLEQMVQQRGLDNVVFADPVPKNEMPSVLAASDVCLATLQGIPMFKTTYPNKVFDYMAAGRPTILGIDGVIRAVVDEADAGLFFEPENARALADAVLQIKSMSTQQQREMGHRARAYVERHFDRDTQTEQFAVLLSSLASP